MLTLQGILKGIKYGVNEVFMYYGPVFSQSHSERTFVV